MSRCKGLKFCVNTIMRLAHEMQFGVNPAERIEGILYRFVVTKPDGTKQGYQSGRALMMDLKTQVKNCRKG
jgi:hypothetical protein